MAVRNRSFVVFMVVCFSVYVGVWTGNCDKTFGMSTLYSNMIPKENASKEMLVSNRMECASKCFNYPHCAGFILNDDHTWCSLYNMTFYSLSFENKTGTEAYEVTSENHADCYEVMISGGQTSGVYVIAPRDNGNTFNVFCEIGRNISNKTISSASNDSGWLVIQRRADGSEDFYRTWNDYKDGFGNLTNEFWLGNTNIHRLTKQGVYELRIELEDFDGNSRYAVYEDFNVASEEEYFKLTIGAYSGDAGDGLSTHSGHNFSTKDRDLDTYKDNCAVRFTGAWWYTSCHSSNLNGKYLRGNHSSYADGVEWSRWLGQYYSLKSSVMKIKRQV